MFSQESALWRWCVVLLFLLIATVKADFNMRHLSTVYLPYDMSGSQPLYSMGESAVEQIAYDTDEKIIYVVAKEIVHVVDASDSRNLQRVLTMKLDGADFTDVEICGDFVFLAVDNIVNRAQGSLRIYRKYNENSNGLEFLQEVQVGVIPDMLQVRPGCKTVLIALEAEAYEDGNTLQNPTGAVIIVEFQDGADRTSNVRVKTLDFENFNDRYGDLSPTGFRKAYPPATLAMDIEPEYIAIDEEGNKAYVALQENNAVAVVDLARDNITAIHGLGYKQWGELDASNSDQGIEITFWPIKGLYQPDSIKYHKWQGRQLVFSANEGDTKEYDVVNFDDSVRGKNIGDSRTSDSIPTFVRTALNNDAQLGRLKFSAVDGLYPNGTYHTLYAFGGRSFSIWDAANNFKLLYDSGSHIEKTTALHCPHLFNTDDGNIDNRSDDKGPETESITVGELAGRLYIFIGNERPGTIFVYSLGEDVSQPRFEMIFCDGIPDNGKSYQELYDSRQIYGADPEDIKFYSASESPSGSPILIVAGTISGTVSILEVTATPDPPSPKEPTERNDQNHHGDNSNVIGSSLLLLMASTFLSCLSRF